LLGLAIWAADHYWRRPPAPTFQPRDWIVIGDFNRFDPEPHQPSALATALRLGLEQSPHVNVLSALTVQDTLQRMGRPPNSRVDLLVGSEVALRQGARVLLVPSIDGIPGHPHIRLQVVEPATRRVLFAEDEYGEGADSALASLDAASRRVRARLGESLAGIRGTGKPMAQVTTTDLVALRSFVQAEAAYRQGDDRQALVFYTRALARDPAYAMAQVGAARVHARSGDYSRSLALAQAAQRNRARLSYPEALELDSFLARFGPPGEALARFKVWATLYPDAYRAHYGYALVALSENLYAEALQGLAPALSPHNPSQGNAWFLRGVILLALNRYQDARTAFDRADALGVGGDKLESAEVYAAERDFRTAEQRLRRQTPTGLAGSEFRLRLDDPVFLLDQGRWTEALAALDQLQAQASTQAPLQARALQATRLSLDGYRGQADAAGYRQLVGQAREALAGTDPIARDQATFLLLAGGWMATRAGDVETGRQGLALGSAPARADGGAALLGMQAILGAELALAQGQPGLAGRMLRARHDGTELYFSHSVLLRALAASGDTEAALAEAAWLARERGRAYAEWNCFDAWNAANIVESHLARLSAAELALKLNRPDDARRHAADFLRDWPQAADLAPIRARLEPLQRALGQENAS
jgi:putative peptide modification system cyclase